MLELAVRLIASLAVVVGLLLLLAQVSGPTLRAAGPARWCRSCTASR